MPAGLDGHPSPVSTPERDAVLDTVVDLIGRRPVGRVLVAVDGRSGSGKSTFADEMAGRLADGGATVVRSTTDSFHRSRAERLQRGTSSPEGYYLDSHRLDVLVGELLEPFSTGAARVRTAAFDEPTDAPVEMYVEVPPEAVLVFDGLFLHRPELLRHWDFTVFLLADERRDEEWLTFLLADLPAGAVERAAELDRRLTKARWPRYREGWRRYVETVDPAAKASVVIDNDDIHRPRVVITT